MIASALTPLQITFDNEMELKNHFAEFLLYKPNQFWNAAKSLFGDDVPRCVYASQYWPTDKDVLAKQRELLEENGIDHYLPTKYDLAFEIWERAMKATLDEDAAKLLRLYADVRGFIEKPAIVNNNTNVQVQKALVITDNGSDDTWRDRVLEHQRSLVARKVPNLNEEATANSD